MDPGDIINGRFQLSQAAASGGMSTVFRAVDLQENRTVAVKVLDLSTPVDIERFRREAELLAGVNHPAVVRYISHGQQAGLHYLAMEWIEGITLQKRLQTQGLTVAESIEVCWQVAGALDVLHQRGLVHRDIKPSNVMFVEGALDRAKLLDFGIARRIDDETGLTAAGTMVGSPGYLSPEQARGQRELTVKTDVFTLGCVLYECLTGWPAFEGADLLAVCQKVLLTEPRPITAYNPDVPEGLAALVREMLTKDPSARPSHAGQVAVRLALLPRPESTFRPERRGSTRGDKTRVTLPGTNVALVPEPGPSPSADTGPLHLLVLILAAESPPVDEEKPPEESTLTSLRNLLTPIAERHQAHLEILPDASASFLVQPSTTEALPARILHFLTELRAASPESLMILFADRVPTDQLEGLIERATRTATQVALEALFGRASSTPPSVRLDVQAAELLKGQLPIATDDSGPYLPMANPGSAP